MGLDWNRRSKPGQFGARFGRETLATTCRIRRPSLQEATAAVAVAEPSGKEIAATVPKQSAAGGTAPPPASGAAAGERSVPVAKTLPEPSPEVHSVAADQAAEQQSKENSVISSTTVRTSGSGCLRPEEGSRGPGSQHKLIRSGLACAC